MLIVGVTVAAAVMVVSLGGVVLLVSDRGHHGQQAGDPWPLAAVSIHPRDDDGSFVAVVVQRPEVVRRGWVVMWSPWRQAYTAMAMWSPEPVIVDAKASDIQQRMADAEAHYALCAA